MKRLLIASIVLAVAAPALAQSTRTQPKTQTSDPDSTITESQKGGPASKESVPGAGGQQTVTKPATPNAGATRTPAPPR
jgi:uncharacterized protein YdeI (BOF family)